MCNIHRSEKTPYHFVYHFRNSEPPVIKHCTLIARGARSIEYRADKNFKDKNYIRN